MPKTRRQPAAPKRIHASFQPDTLPKGHEPQIVVPAKGDRTNELTKGVVNMLDIAQYDMERLQSLEGMDLG